MSTLFWSEWSHRCSVACQDSLQLAFSDVPHSDGSVRAPCCHIVCIGVPSDHICIRKGSCAPDSSNVKFPLWQMCLATLAEKVSLHLIYTCGDVLWRVMKSRKMYDGGLQLDNEGTRGMMDDDDVSSIYMHNQSVGGLWISSSYDKADTTQYNVFRSLQSVHVKSPNLEAGSSRSRADLEAI